ncbi:MAG: ArsR/SmtB family transcription factor [Alphaproteobacteria bacterium]
MIIDFPEKYFHHHEVNELSRSALQMAALGSEPRLSLFRLLVVAGNQGLFTGMISEQLKIAGSTLNHHLATLETAGLIRRIREGRNIRCVVQTDEIDDLISYLTRNCCAGLDGGCEHV